MVWEDSRAKPETSYYSLRGDNFRNRSSEVRFRSRSEPFKDNFDRRVIYPWENDPSCAQFSIQVKNVRL